MTPDELRAKAQDLVRFFSRTHPPSEIAEVAQGYLDALSLLEKIAEESQDGDNHAEYFGRMARDFMEGRVREWEEDGDEV